ncbi:GH-E family nuclease [Tenacibaculum larymnensis]|uniref:HNH/ENDO VII family nuclease n=1 Tax=Tenacibaculum larymnensis TaxID=2878201 RepID=A0A9X4ERQ2_9FLAO|nr:GH-E family nuclease [Tenacibaculum larymnensis]MDE1206970.1 HNH/ENDO VII family nuclease [Tenacibaculum larymnensis]
MGEYIKHKKEKESNIFQRTEGKGSFLEDNRGQNLLPIQRGKKNEDDDSGDDYQPPWAKKQKRFAFKADKPTKLIKKTAHKRKHYDKEKYDAVYTCPACRRPLGYINKGSQKMNLTKFSYTSKNNNLKSQRALTLDHFPPWAGRLSKLESRNATDQEMKDDYNDEDRLRALCKKCNESHKYESTKYIDYESDDDEEGYMTDSEEPENSGIHTPFRYKKDDDDSAGGGAGILA